MSDQSFKGEPSVLDYVKSKLTPWKHAPVEITAPAPEAGESAPIAVPEEQRTAVRLAEWPWRSLGALLLALVAQRALEPAPGREWVFSAFLYLLAAAGLFWSAGRGEWRIPAILQAERREEDFTWRAALVWISLPLALVAFLLFAGNRFTTLNVLVWLLAAAALVWGFWQKASTARSRTQRLEGFLSRSVRETIRSPWPWAVLGVAGLAVFFRFYQLGQVPPEMNSDHAEKLLDVWDVLQGETRIFFPRNTGREALQFYLTAAVIKIFGTGISFTSLKIGTALAGLAALPYVYLLGKEISGREVGLWAAAFAAIAYWPNVISRVALRFALYPLFVAPTLYYLIRGLRRGNRNDFLLAGLALGIGLHGYTSTRILPLVVLVAVGLYLLHNRSRTAGKTVTFHLALLVAVSLVLFLPLLRFALENPDLFAYRSFTRLADWERPLPDSPLAIFLRNLWDAWVMFFWDNGEIWLHSVPHRPALSAAAAALYFLGLITLLVRYARRRNWVDLFLIVSIPLLMLPSILSLAFPGENPSLNRTGGAIIPVFLIVGTAAQSIVETVRAKVPRPSGLRLAWAIPLLLLAWAGLQDYDLVFNQYRQQYARSSWNTSELGQAVRDFDRTIGDIDHAWVIPYPHWVDTRLVGMQAGYPTRDLALLLENLDQVPEDGQPKLFLVKHDDEGALQTLNIRYPEGWGTVYNSAVENHDFVLYFVPKDR